MCRRAAEKKVPDDATADLEPGRNVAQEEDSGATADEEAGRDVADEEDSGATADEEPGQDVADEEDSSATADEEPGRDVADLTNLTAEATAMPIASSLCSFTTCVKASRMEVMVGLLQPTTPQTHQVPPSG